MPRREEPPAQDDGPPLSEDDAQPSVKSTDDDFKPATEEKDELPAVGRVWEGAGPTSVFAAFKKAGPKPAPPKPAPLPVVSADGPVDKSDLPKLMAQFLSAAERAAPAVAHFLEGARVKEIDDRGTLTLVYYKDFEASPQMLERGGRRETLQNILTDLLGEPIGIKCEVAEENSPAVAQRPAPPPPRSAPKSSPEPQAQPAQNLGIPVTEELRAEILQNNPLAKSLADQLGARIVKVE